MKLVREHINEKFTKDSDSIADMGIGLITAIRKYLRNKNYSDDFNDSEKAYTALSKLIEDKKLDFVEYLLKHNILKMSRNDFRNVLANTAFVHAWDVCKLLVEYGVNLDMTIRECSKRHSPLTYEALLKLHEMIYGNKAGYVYERFEEGGDPVADLGIGIRAKLERESLKVLKHQSAQGYRIAAYMSHFAKISEENLYEIEPQTANKLMKKSIVIKDIEDMETGIGIGFTLRKIWIDEDDDFSGRILIEKNSFRSLYWADLKAALKAYELENLTDN